MVSYTQKAKKLIFHDVKPVEQPSDEVSQKKMSATIRGKNLLDKDITDHE